ncbi:MAG: response regulator [Thermodesulfobacteriota bacterium]
MPHVLIADDDRILRKRIVRAITDQNAGIVIHEADNGEEAINLMKGQAMDLVITDIRMPKVSGLMLLAFLNAFAPAVPCFVITAYGTARLKSKMPPDLIRFYDKPINAGELAVSAMAVLSRQRDPNTCGGIQLPDFVNVAAKAQATATLTVTQEGHPPCKLFLKGGELIDAVMADERGEAAAIRAMSLPSPNYAIDFGLPGNVERTITTPLAQLLRTVSECFDKT